MSGFDGSDTTRRFEAALAAWGPGSRLGDALGGGHRNDVRLVTIDGDRRAARLSPRPTAALIWELRLLDSLRAAGLRVPAALPARDGRRCVDGLILFEWLDGEPPATPDDWRRVRETLQRVHDTTRTRRQRPGFRSTTALLRATRGGDVRLDLMPPDVVARCRAAWRPLRDEPRSVVHGDPGAANIRITRAGVGLFDWDEARVDLSILDLAAQPDEVVEEIDPPRLAAARRALDAWETATGWIAEPAYARRRLARLVEGPGVGTVRYTTDREIRR